MNPIQDHSDPRRVKYRKLGDVVANLDNQRRPVTRSSREAGDYPYYGANGVQDYVNDFILDGTFLLMGEDGSVVRKDGSPVLNWAAGKIWVNNHAHVLAARSDALELRFLYFYLQTVDITSYVTGGMQPKLNQGNLNRIPVPVPSVKLQREIVAVLDHLSSLVAELSAELEAERAARNAQYAFYRDSLYSVSAQDDVLVRPLIELGEFVRGRRFTKSDMVEQGIPSIHYGEIYTTYGISATQTVSHVRADLAPQLRYAKPNDVVVAAVGETVEDVGKGVAWLGTTEVAIHDDCFLYRSKSLDPKYVSYYLRTSDLIRAKDKYVSRAKVKRMSIDGLGRLKIPVPTLQEQRRVVAILDDYAAIASDLDESFPAEIAARRKQFEYYRNILLDFQEAAA